MPLIEGVGDEVTHFLVILLIVVVGIAAWWSTSTSDQPLIRTVLILEPHSAHQSIGTVAAAAMTAAAAGQDTGQTNTIVLTERDLQQAATASSGSSSLNKNPVTSTAVQTQDSCGSTSSSGISDNPRVNSNQSNNHTSIPSEGNPAITNIISNLEVGGNELRRRIPFNRPAVNEDHADVGQSQVAANSPAITSIDVDSDAKSFSERAENSSENTTTGSSGINNESKNENCARKNNLKSSSASSETLEDPTHVTTVTCVCQSNTSTSKPCSCGKTATATNNLNQSNGITDGIRIRLIYLNDSQKLVQGRLQEPLGDFKRRHFGVELQGNKVVRLIFNGQVLHSDNQTLQNYGLFDNCVVHCLVYTRRSTSPNESSTGAPISGDEATNGNSIREWDLSHALYAMMASILTMAWYSRFFYPQLFTLTSSLALLGLSGVFGISLYRMYIGEEDGARA